MKTLLQECKDLYEATNENALPEFKSLVQSKLLENAKKCYREVRIKHTEMPYGDWRSGGLDWLKRQGFNYALTDEAYVHAIRIWWE
ncbi:MAG: hypothetical protein ACRCWQ_02215 [Bacilli bacterium]